METVCLICGDKGFDVALDTCHECQDYACHRYCRRVLPTDLSDDGPWLCEDCNPDFSNVCTVESCSSPTFEGVNDTTKPDKEQLHKPRSEFEKNDIYNVSSSESEAQEDVCQGRTDHDEAESRLKNNDDQKLKKRRRLFLEEEENLEASLLSVSHLLEALESSNVLKETIVTGSQPKLKEKKCDLQNKPQKHGSGVPVRSVKSSNTSEKKGISGNVAKDQKPKKRKLILEEEEEDDYDAPMGTAYVTKASNTVKENIMTGSEAKKPMPLEIRDKDWNILRKQKGSVPESQGGDRLNAPLVAMSDIKHSNISRHRVASSPASSEKHKPLIRNEKPTDVQCPNPGKVQSLGLLEEKITDSPEPPRDSTSDAKPNAFPSKVSETKPSNYLPRQKAICGSVDETKVEPRGGNEPQRKEQRYSNQKLGYRHRPLGTYGKNRVGPRNQHHRRLVDNDSTHSRFIHRSPVWRGTFRICNKESRTTDRFPVAGHLSTSANAQASDVAQKLPNCLFLDTFSRSQLWPNSFNDTGPNSHHIALYFVSDNRNDTLERFIDYMIDNDLAMIAVFENVELVVFTSYVLPVNCQMIESKYFLWGGFRTRIASSLTNQLRCQQLRNVGAGR